MKLEIEWKQIEEEEDYFIRLVLVLNISEFLVKNKYEGEKKNNETSASVWDTSVFSKKSNNNNKKKQKN